MLQRIRSCAWSAVIGGLLLAASVFAQVPPYSNPPFLPTPDPAGPTNLFYGAVPPAGDTAPVLLFVHGLHASAENWWTNNDMYNLVYQWGYRSAFVSLNGDGSMAENSAMLKTLLPLVVAHYQVPKVYIVAHSKGGLDTEQALLNSQMQSLVKAVFTISTPNHGTELADWLLGPGLPLAKLWGFDTPAVADLQTASVAAFRAQADPILQASGIQFYTLWGDVHTGNPLLAVTGTVLKTLTGGFKSPANDGLVPVPSTLLPWAYGMPVVSLEANHFETDNGDISFPAVRNQIEAIERIVPGFKRVATGGFGDDNNSWIWSMGWFKGKLYVGTGRDENCVSTETSDVQQGTHFYPPPASQCSPDPKDLQLRAEIWQYTPETKTWARVYQSPQDIPIGNDASGQPIVTAHDVGYRGMAVFTEPNGTQALYVGAVTSSSIFDQIPPYNTNGFPPPRILRTTDGVNWAPIPQDPGTFLGDIVKNSPSQLKVRGFRSLLVFNGKLFATASDYRGVGFIVASSNPAQGNNAWQQVSPPATTMPVWSLAVFNNYLYCSTGDRLSDQAYAVYKTSGQGPAPYTFTPVITNGAYLTGIIPASKIALSLKVFNNQLYVGTDRPAEMVRINPDDTWDLIVGEPRNTPAGFKAPLSGIGQFFGNTFNGHFWNMGVSPGGMYMATWDWSTEARPIPVLQGLFAIQYGSDLLNTQDGIHWRMISNIGLGDGLNYGGRSFLNTPYGLFMGTARPIGGAQVWLNNSVLDLNNDGIIDQRDVGVIMAAVGQPASGPNDPRDLDQDGKITVLDARKLATQCTNAACAGPMAGQILPQGPPPVTLHSAPGPMGGVVRLDWNASPGAVKYRIYRSPIKNALEFFPPQGIPITLFGLSINIPQDFLNGNLSFLCDNPDSLGCLLLTAVQQINANSNIVGFPSATEFIAETTQPAYQEMPPNGLQQIYFVRPVDSLGRLGQVSNIVGGPSKAPQ